MSESTHDIDAWIRHLEKLTEKAKAAKENLELVNKRLHAIADKLNEVRTGFARGQLIEWRSGSRRHQGRILRVRGWQRPDAEAGRFILDVQRIRIDGTLGAQVEVGPHHLPKKQ